MQTYRSDVIQTTVTNALIGLIGLITGILAARILGAEGRGQLAAIQLWPMTIVSIACAGTAEAIVYLSARRTEAALTYLATALVYALVAGSALAAIILWALPRLLEAYPPTITTAAYKYFLIIPAFVFLTLLYSVLRGIGSVFAWNVSRMLPQLGWLGILVVMAFLGIASAAVAATTYIVVLSLLAVLITTLLRKWRVGVFRSHFTAFRGLITYGFPSALVLLGQLAQQRIDQIVLVPAVESAQLGIYVVALGWAGMTSPMLHAIGALACQRIAALDAGGALPLFASTVRISLCVAIATAIAVSIITPLALPLLFGVPFRASVDPALVLIWAMALSGLRYVIAEGLRGLGLPTRVLIVESVATFVTVAAVSVAVLKYGIMGAAFGVAVGAIAGFVTAIWIALGTARSHGVDLFMPSRRDLQYVLDAVSSMWKQVLRAFHAHK